MTSVARSVLAGPLVLGLRAVGERRPHAPGGSTPERASSAYLDGLELLHRREDVELWVLAVVALIRLVGTDRADVRDAVAELRRELDRIGAAGALEAVDRAVRAATGDAGAPGPATSRRSQVRRGEPLDSRADHVASRPASA